MRRIEFEDAEQQFEPDQTIPSTALRTGPIPINDNRDEAATPTPAEKKVDLKKQSQFVTGQNGATDYEKGDYDNMPTRVVEENKAKQSQIQAPASIKGAGKSKKSLAAANRLTG